MFILILGIIIFSGVHLFPNFAASRQRLIAVLGEGPYKGLFSLLALIGLVLIIVGKSRAEFQPLWQTPVWGRDVAMAIMIPSLILFAAANMPSNIKRFTRHPMLWGLTLWAASHLIANGDLASLLLFGGLGGFALCSMFFANRRGLSKQQTKFPYAKDAMTVMVGCVAYGVFFFLHPYLSGVPLM